MQVPGGAVAPPNFLDGALETRCPRVGNGTHRHDGRIPTKTERLRVLVAVLPLVVVLPRCLVLPGMERWEAETP